MAEEIQEAVQIIRVAYDVTIHFPISERKQMWSS